jgi:hypothetical protein
MTVKAEDSNLKANRLVNEKSPYLLQHAYNPVDWYPWGSEAFAKAEAENKPVFLSIGYSTCHWCHVMEQDSFEDDQVAALLNEYYVPVKVDREERPDLDQKYMAACQALTGQGGWPLTVFLTPAKKPFYAATFIPKQARYGMTGMLEILPSLSKYWKEERGRVIKAGDELDAALRSMAAGSSAGTASAGSLDNLKEEELIAKGYQLLKTSFDQRHAGFGDAPKFPAAHQLLFLLDYGKRFEDDEAVEMAVRTLKAIHRGGIFDQIGFGLHRYSVDERWLVPHFEKMLYDQAVTALAAIEAYRATEEPEMAELAKKIFRYVLSELISEEGAFYAAEDADSEGEEGTFYVWSPAELIEALGEERGKIAASYYGVSREGNFEKGKSVLYRPHDNDTGFAAVNGLTPERLTDTLEDTRKVLVAKRSTRERPFRDDKIITAWNALIIAALSRGSELFGEQAYLKAAEKAAAFIMAKMVSEQGRLLRRYREGEAAIPAFLDDYAAMVWAYLELYRVSGSREHLTRAKHLNNSLLSLFYMDNGLLRYSAGMEEDLEEPEGEGALVAEAYDGASPSGVSMAAMNLLRMGHLLQDDSLTEKGVKVIAAQVASIRRHPTGFTYLLTALNYALAPGEVSPRCTAGGSCGLE